MDDHGPASGLAWFKVADLDELAENRVKTVVAGRRSICLTHHDGQYGALDNRCPHQGGPLGEGSIENGWLRCPWHGWDYCPLTGSRRRATTSGCRPTRSKSAASTVEIIAVPLLV